MYYLLVSHCCYSRYNHGLLDVCIYVDSVLRQSSIFFFFQAEDGIRDLVRSRGLGDVYKRQPQEMRRLQRLPPIRRDQRGAVVNLEVGALRIHHNLSLIHI